MAIEATALDATSPPQVVGERVAARAVAVGLAHTPGGVCQAETPAGPGGWG